MSYRRLHFRSINRSINSRDNKRTTLDNYRKDLVETIKKSQDSFDTQLPFIAAGGIGVSMAFISDIVKIEVADGLAILFLGWFLLTTSLFINFFSHNICIKKHRQTVFEIDSKKYDFKKALERDSLITKWNNWSVISMVTGIFCILLFIALNTTNMSKQVKPANPATERKGRTSPTTPPVVKSPAQPPKPDTGRTSPTRPPQTKK